jgi:hypothetical protein
MSFNHCFYIKFDKIYNETIDKMEIDWHSSHILRLLDILLYSEGICADCFLKFKNLYTTDISDNKIVPNEELLNLLKTVIPDYIPSSITWSFSPEDSYQEYTTEKILSTLRDYEIKRNSEEIDNNYEASELFRSMLSDEIKN